MNAGPDNSPVIVPPVAVTSRRGPRRPWKRWVAGLLALVGLGVALPFSVASIRAQHALDTAPICAAGHVDRECRQRIQVTVTDVRVFGRDGSLSISTREFGELVVDSLPVQLHAGDRLTVEVWRDAAVRVDVAGTSSNTLAAPSNDGLGWLMLIVVTSLAAHFTLRSLSRRRLWIRLGRHPSFTAETRMVGAIGFVLFVILLTGIVLLIAGVTAGAAVIIAYQLLIIYGLFVPQYSTRLIRHAIAAEADHGSRPVPSPRRVVSPVSDSADHP